VLLDLTTAATLLGYSASGLRKLIRRGDIRYFQSRPHAPIKFRQAWLDEFVERGSAPEEPVVRRRKPRLPEGGGVIDPALLNL
jgi:hypothetical protein